MHYLFALISLFVISQTGHAFEHSVVVGLHIEHFKQNDYADFRKAPKETGELRDGQWVLEYQDESLNDGFSQNNQLIGYRIKGNHYATTVLTYKNSYYERSYGLAFNKTYRLQQILSVETGAMLVSGYREGLVLEDKNASFKQSLMLVPMMSAAYALNDALSLTYTTMTMSVGIFGLEYRIYT